MIKIFNKSTEIDLALEDVKISNIKEAEKFIEKAVRESKTNPDFDPQERKDYKIKVES